MPIPNRASVPPAIPTASATPAAMPSPLLSSNPQHSFLQKVKELLKDPDAVWVCVEQREATLALWEKKKDVIVGMRTGAGKSMVCILPSFFEWGRTIIIIPLQVLLNDWVRRLVEMGVDHQVYTGRENIRPTTKIILISADVARFPTWKVTIRDIHAMLPILRIILEEAGEFFVNKHFRPVLDMAYDFHAELACQYVALTATSPRTQIGKFANFFGLFRPLFITMSCHRLELKYEVRAPSNDRAVQDSRAKDIVERRISSADWLVKGRVLIFVLTKADGERLANVFKCDFLYSAGNDSDMTKEAQAEIYSSWTSGERSIILIATSALTAGTDYPHVHLVIFYGAPTSIITYHQQASRGGRDGRTTNVIILPFKNMFPVQLDPAIESLCGNQAMHCTVYETKHLPFPFCCLRFALGEFLNGVGQPCQALNGAVLCDHCENSTSSSSFEFHNSRY